LFLKRGIEYFSVIDFSPHFPGYVSLILLGKALNLFFNDAFNALFMLTISCAVFIPLLSFIYLKQKADEKTAWIGFIFILTSPYLVHFSLIGLSDSVGFFFLLLALICLNQRWYFLCGMIISVAFFARPSYIILFTMGFVYLCLYEKQVIKSLLMGFMILNTLFMLYIVSTQGNVFFIEALRFVQGHFSLWGTSKQSAFFWMDNIFSWVNLPFLLLFIHKYSKKYGLLYAMVLAYGVWMILAQNPENLRHLIPLIFLLSLLMSDGLHKRKVLFLIAVVFNVSFHFMYVQVLSPIEQIKDDFGLAKPLVISNRSIETLRESGFLVIDKFYKGRSNFYRHSQSSIMITSNQHECQKCKKYEGRFIGERPLYVKTDTFYTP
jgi:hypothetical protein